MKKKPLDEQLLDEIKKKKLTPKETQLILRGMKNHNSWKKYKTVDIEFSDKHVKFGVFADAHIGHECYRPDVLRTMIADGKRESIEFWLNVGDTIEGMSGREGHIYELTHLGATQQLNYFTKEFKLFRNTVYSIEAQNSHSGWYNSKGNTGLNIGEEMQRRSKHYNFIGYDEQDIILDNGLRIRLRHPGGGTAYAISYKMQKYVESISGGKKPNLLFQGHFHKSIYMFYRNIHCFESGTLCEQTPFMRKIGTPAHIGYWIVDVAVGNKGGVDSIKSRFVPFYE